MSVRLIPAVIFVAVLMLSVRVGDIWTSLSQAPGEPAAPTDSRELSVRVGPAQAQDQEQDQGGDGTQADGQDGAGAEGGAESAGESGDAAPQGMEPLETTDAPASEFAGDDGELKPGELRLIHDLAKRRERLEERARELDEREALLAAAEDKLVAKQKKLEALREEIETLVARFDDAQEKEATLLRQTYQNMKPKAAAAIFNDLDMKTILDVVRGMPARKLAPILADMTPPKARTVTQELAIQEELPELPQN